MQTWLLKTPLFGFGVKEMDRDKQKLKLNFAITRGYLILRMSLQTPSFFKEYLDSKSRLH